MSADQIPAKEFMRRVSSIDKSLQDIAKSLSTLTKIVNRQFPHVTLVPSKDEIEEFLDREDDQNE